jgi:transcriptional regulator with XRE-family HTH domain
MQGIAIDYIMDMSRNQCRAARALLGMTQIQLAEAAKVSPSTVTDFELNSRKVSRELVQTMRIALELAGIIFLDDGGVTLRRRK